MKYLSNNTKGAIFCIISGLLYGPLGYFGVTIMRGNISASTMLFWRYTISALVILIILIPKFKHLCAHYKLLFFPLLLGLLFYGSNSYLYFLASHYIGTGLAMIIFFVYPVIVMLLNWIFYKQKPSPIYYVSMGVILIGLALLVDIETAKKDVIGILLSIGSAFGYASYIAASKKSVASVPPMESTLMVSLGSSIFCFITSLCTKSFVIPESPEIWVNIFYIATISTAAPILFLLKGLKYIKSDKASILSVLEPVCVFFMGVIVLKETVSYTEAIGAIVILAGAMLVQLDKTRNENTST